MKNNFIEKNEPLGDNGLLEIKLEIEGCELADPEVVKPLVSTREIAIEIGEILSRIRADKNYSGNMHFDIISELSKAGFVRRLRMDSLELHL